jgi:hypothetical protein
MSTSLVATGVLFGAGAGVLFSAGAGVCVLPSMEGAGVRGLLGSAGTSAGVGVVVAAAGVAVAMVLRATWATGGGTPGSMCIIPFNTGSPAPSSEGQARSLH